MLCDIVLAGQVNNQLNFSFKASACSLALEQQSLALVPTVRLMSFTSMHAGSRVHVFQAHMSQVNALWDQHVTQSAWMKQIKGTTAVVEAEIKVFLTTHAAKVCAKQAL